VTSAFVSPAEQVRAARAVLTALDDRLGSAGLAAASVLPGLSAAIDQHAAAIRDALSDGIRAPGLVALAGYVEGIRDQGLALDWRIPAAHNVHWPNAEWPVVRLLAVSALAQWATED